MKNNSSLSIGSLAELRAEMNRMKNSVALQEAALVQRATRLPAETAKAVVTALVPALIGGELASGLWRLGKGLFEYFRDRKSGGDQSAAWKETLTGSARKLGVVSIMKLLFSLWKGR